MEEKLSLPINLIQAKDLTPFQRPDGRRIMFFHYYFFGTDGWQMRWIEPGTDGAWLLEMIKEGLIYIHNYEQRGELDAVLFY